MALILLQRQVFANPLSFLHYAHKVANAQPVVKDSVRCSTPDAFLFTAEKHPEVTGLES